MFYSNRNHIKITFHHLMCIFHKNCDFFAFDFHSILVSILNLLFSLTEKKIKQKEEFYAYRAVVKQLKQTQPSTAELVKTQNHCVTFVHNIILVVKKPKNTRYRMICNN